MRNLNLNNFKSANFPTNVFLKKFAKDFLEWGRKLFRAIIKQFEVTYDVMGLLLMKGMPQI